MCGVVAVVGAAVDAGAMDRALDALAHRGPDGRGVWRGEHVALGHTRLAIVDPLHGAQPIANEDGSVVAIVNGEIYEDAAHAQWLGARGHTLRTRCDAELVVHLYEEHGADFVRHVRGELAFVLWDAKRRRLVAGRDRFGIKPLLWARFGDGIALASEAKALFALGVPARWDDESFFHAAHVQYPLPDRTLFGGVYALEPGCVMTWEAGAPAVHRYWQLPAATSSIATLDDAVEQLRDALAESVRVRLRADARVCVQLSGGIDSSTIAALATPGVEAAFTVAFTDGGAYDERAIARATAEQLGLPHHLVEVHAGDIATDWLAAVAHGEGLAINGHVVGKWRLSRAMRDAGFKVVLTGEGADELLAGYPHLRTDAGAHVEGHAASRGVMLPSGDALSTDSVHARLGYVPTWLAAKAALGHRVRGLLSADFVRAFDGVDPFGALVEQLDADRLRGMARLHASAESWMRTALAQYILRMLGDGMEMAHSMEGRVPFLDVRIAELAMSIDPAILVGDALDKPVLRRAMAGRVPAALLARPKHPFLAPPLSTLAPSLVQDTLRTHARRSAHVDAAALERVLDALPAMSDDDRQRWDPALMLLLSAAVIESRYVA